MIVIFSLLTSMTESERSYSTPGWPLIALLGVASLITGLDFTIVYVALPHLASDFGVPLHDAQWVISAYAIAFGAPLLLAGRLVDLIGARRVFIFGMLGFTAGSALGALAPTMEWLIAGRVLQGLGAAALFPSTLALVTTCFPEGRRRNRALAAWAGAGAAGLSLGAISGGMLTDLTGWQGVFWVNVPMTTACIVAATRLIPADGRRLSARGMDLPGALTGSTGVALLVFCIATGAEQGWHHGQVLASGCAALVVLAGFLAIETRSSRPLLPLALFANANFRVGVSVIFAFGMTLNAVPYVLTQYFQSVLSMSAMAAGLAFLIPTVAITAGTIVGEKVLVPIGTRAVIQLGLLLGGIGALALSVALDHGAGLAPAAPAMALFGLGLGAVYPAMFGAASTDVRGSDVGAASGFSSCALQVGTATGLAFVAAISAAGTHPVASQLSNGLQNALLVAAAGAGVAAVLATLLPVGRHAHSEPESGQVHAEATDPDGAVGLGCS